MDMPQIQYARTDDGVNLAYWTLGAGPPLIWSQAPTLSHLTLEWELPGRRWWYEQLASQFTVVRYSSRCAGLSDRDVPDITPDAYTRDIVTLIDAIGASRAALIAGDVPVHIGYLDARLSAFIALGVVDSPRVINVAKAITEFREETWASTFADWNDPHQQDPRDDLIRLIRGSLDAADRPRLREQYQNGMYQPPGRLGELSVPALIVDWPQSSYRSGTTVRELSTGIPNARLVERPGASRAMYDEDREGLLDIITRFIRDNADVLSEGARSDAAPPATAFTSREAEILKLLAHGPTNRAIAEELGISHWTVARHVNNLLNKTDLSNRTELAAYALENGYA